MTVRALPLPLPLDVSQRAAPEAVEGSGASAEDPMIALLREDTHDENLNTWAESAAERVLARFRQKHGTVSEEKHTGIFTSKSG
jgi:predicted ArsR family transcriptional regulator